jgi:hypothetical protein
MTFLEVYLIGGLLVLGLMALLWLISLALKDSSIVDPFWGSGFVIVNWLYFALTPDGLPAMAKLGQGRGFPLPEVARGIRKELVVVQLLQGVLFAGRPAVDYFGSAAGGAVRHYIWADDL